MSKKMINITINANLTTDFYIEVPDDFSDEEIKKLAAEQTVFPHNFPNYLTNLLRSKMGVNINGIDSMFNSWNLDKVEYIINK